MTVHPEENQAPPLRVLVLGLGTSGIAAAKYVASRRAGSERFEVLAVDEADTPALRTTAEDLGEMGVTVILGACDAPDADLIVASPGIPPSSALMRSARALGAPVISEVEFAFTRSRSPWIAVTGTNGKTTTTCLIEHLLVASGVPAETVGNIGTPPIQVVDEAGEAVVFVAEVSSFQLASTREFHPRAAVLLNITPDHMDWHPDMGAYAADKARIFANQGPDDLAVVVVDDPGAAPFAEQVESRGVRVCRVSVKQWNPGGAGLLDGWLAIDRPEGVLRLIERRELPLLGDHNVLNALSAAAAALELGATPEGVRAGLKSFLPAAHRLQPVMTVGDVEYVDDSKATNPDAVIKALETFADRAVVVLLGGREKGTDFRPMARSVGDHCRAAVLFGEAAETIAAAFDDLDVPLHFGGKLAEAVAVAASVALPGDVVLLSPACASFDEFTGYAQRGEVFVEAVRALAEERSDG